MFYDLSFISGPEKLIFSLILIYLALSRFFPFLLASFFQYKFNCSITIGRIGLPYFALHNVRIKKNDFLFVIDRVGFTSSLVKSEAPKLLSVIISSLRIILLPKSEKGNSAKPSIPRLRKKLKAPAFISNIVQFLGVHINELHFWTWEKIDDKKGVHCNAEVGNVSIDGCTTVGNISRTNICACIALVLEKIEARICENWLPRDEDLQAPMESSYFNGKSGVTLLEWNFDFRLNVMFSPKNSGEFIENLNIDVDKLSIFWKLKEKSISLFSAWSARKPSVDVGAIESSKKLSKNESDGKILSIIERLEDIVLKQSIPKYISFRIFETECKISVVDTGSLFESFINGFSFVSKCNITKIGDKESIMFESQVNLGLIRIEPDPHQYFSVDQFSNYIKFSNNKLNIDLDITNLSLKSYEKGIQFSKTKFNAISQINDISRETFKLKDIFKSFDIKFENSELDLQYIDKNGYLGNIKIDAECKDLSHIWHEDNSLFELVLSNACTSLIASDNELYCPVSFEFLEFKLRREQTGAKLFGKLCGSRFHWMPHFEIITDTILSWLTPKSKSSSKSKTKSSDSFMKMVKGVNIEIVDSKLIYKSDKDLLLNADLGSLSTTSDKHHRNINITKFEVFSSSNYEDCTLNPVFTIPKCDYNSKSDQSIRYEFIFDANTVMYWSPLLHLQIHQFIEKVQSIKSQFSPNGEKEKKSSSTKLRIFCLKFNKSFSLIGKLSKSHFFELNTDDWRLEFGANHFDLYSKLINISFDKVHVGRFDEFLLSQGPQYLDLTRVHRKMAGLATKKNIAWFVDIAKLSLTFPFGYNFASAFNEEFVTCFKWLKKKHSKPSSETPVPWRDLSIKIHSARIEVGDDPFEVKLRDNYELLEDEYFENLKRFQVLDMKISQLYKTNLLMSSSKVDELRSQLREKGSGIYVQRSKQLYRTHPMRTHLLLWELEDIQLVTMTDTTLFGKETLMQILQELDPESPWPQDGIEFSTLWCRAIHLDISKWRIQLRDFPQPLMDSNNIHFWGKLAGAEALATKRALRSCEILIGGPYTSELIERSLNTMKWYYDLNCEVDNLSVAFGPCWEPVLAQCSLAFENILSPPKDPSKPLPFWDKIRLNFHGRLYMAVKTLTNLLHASLNPYNTTEEMEVTWTDVAIAWTNGKIIFDGELNIYVRTASKYDDCRMLHLPSVRLTFKLNWVCLADSNDHHAIIPCAPDKLPEYSSNQEHDSYRAFRSQNLNMSINLETRGGRPNSCPTAVLYGSTLRWFENLKLILSGTTRPTRRGVLFKNTRSRKIPISRHYKKIRLSLSLNRYHICYWVSFSMQSGIEIFSGKLSSCSEHLLTLTPNNDGLIHRPKAEWSVVYMNSELNDTEIWLQASLQQNINNEINFRRPIEKFFFMSIDKLSYGRDALLAITADSEGNKNETPQHRLVVHELKGAWTSSNRDVAFALFDSLVKVQQLKKNLSTEALKSFFSKHETQTSSPVHKNESKSRTSEHSPPSSRERSQIGSSPLSNIQGQSAAANLLQKLVSEVESHGVVFSEDHTALPPQQSLHGVAQSSLDDVIHHKWLIELVNCQVLLKGCETSGYVILSSAKAHILQREHKPVWKHGTLVPKTTWVGALEGMQYYATVGNTETPEENIQWLSVENIEERDACTISIPDMVGSGQSVGGVVSETVGALSESIDSSVQLQRIVSRCKCEFFYTTYGETGVDKVPIGIPDIPPPPRDIELWDEINKPVEAFTLMHYDLNIFTNSLQYAMILDIVNNLVLYVDPKRKEGFEKLQRLRFKLQLQSYEAQRGPIQQLQNHLRTLVNQLRRLEKEAYSVQKSLADDSQNEQLKNQQDSLERQVNECKEQVAAKGEELHMMVLCYKEAKLAATQRLSRKRDNKDIYLVRVYEICFKHAQWRLTQTDGQLGIADMVLSNFLYTKTAKSDDSVEHLCELGYITVTNLLPNQIYKDVLVPSHIHASMPVDRQRTLRVFCRDRPPVGGIAVKEHFEINIAPINIGMTYQFFKTLFKFCFPEKDPEKLDEVEISDTDSIASGSSLNSSGIQESQMFGGSVSSLPMKGKKARVKRKESKFYVAMSEKDDVEKMKERAERNMLFICVKVPEVPVRVSYKGEKEKNIEDVHDVQLVIPTVEYNNITWTWLDLLVAIRNHSKRVLLSQAIKQKLLWTKTIFSDSNTGPQEEDQKAKMLLGLPSDQKKSKSLFGQHKK